MTPATGRPPDTGDTPLIVRFRNGQESKKPLPARKWRWTFTDYEFDIVAWREAEDN